MSFQNKFIIISPTYNTAPYIEKCIMSAVNQDYDNYEFLVVEDRSVDGTREKVWELQRKYKFQVCYNAIRTESPIGNFAKGVELMPGDPEDILVTLDGDDWLAHNEVLSKLNEVYQDPKIWLTYGQFESASGNIKNMCQPLTDTRRYRKSRFWVTSHLRSIKRKLWDKINQDDLKDKNGNYYVYYPDAAYMFPAIEMAGLRHIKFIPDVLYIYNDLSPLCSADDWRTKDKKDMKLVYDVSREIRSKPVYPELQKL